MEKALLVTIKLESEKDNWNIDQIAQELEELVRSSGAEVVGNIACKMGAPSADLFVGKGKAEEITSVAQEEEADLVIFSHDISGTQQRNLENIIGKKTIDRTQLILDIFSMHARSPEGKVQVELAQLQYLMPRLLGKGILLSRLGGGIGTRGPGEKKLEVDRRRIQKRVDRLKKDFHDLTNHRKVIRKKRTEDCVATIALVGYTNAGKSTLINSLTQGTQVVRNSLFTTLDPLSKGLKLANGQRVVLSDTVGFLNKLPHHLIEAFKATLEEVQEADLLLHVLDIASPLVKQHHQAVLDVLKELRVDHKPTVTALNKIDLLEDQSWIHRSELEFKNAVAISAKSKQNFDALLEEIVLLLKPKMCSCDIVLSLSRMDIVDLFYREGNVRSIDYTENGINILVDLPNTIVNKLLKDSELDNSIRISKKNN